MATRENSHNIFESLMDQLQSTCPPGFLEKCEGKNDVVQEPINAHIPTRAHHAQHSNPTRPRRFVPPLEEEFLGQRPISYRPSGSFVEKVSYRPPMSPSSYEQRSSPRAAYRPPISPRSYDSGVSSPKAYRPSMSPRTPSFERKRSWSQPRNLSRRIYVFNIPKEVTEQEFRESFSQIGTLTSCGFEKEENAQKDTKSGFIAFREISVTNEVLQMGNKFKLRGKEIRMKRATSQKSQLFVGGYDLYSTKTELISFFSQYGEVCDFVMKFTSEGVNRCFGFVTFRDSEDAANKLVEERFLECLGKTVEIKKANQTKRSFTSYGGTPVKRRNPSSSRFSRDALEQSGVADSVQVISRNSSSGSTSYDADVPIDGTKMYSRKFFAPTRPGMKTNNSHSD